MSQKTKTINKEDEKEGVGGDNKKPETQRKRGKRAKVTNKKRQ
jgi:hypothetical protein